MFPLSFYITIIVGLLSPVVGFFGAYLVMLILPFLQPGGILLAAPFTLGFLFAWIHHRLPKTWDTL